MFNPRIHSEIERYAKSFRNAMPFRHVVIDDFLQPDVASAMLASFPEFEAGHAANEVGEVGRKAVVPRVRELPEPYPQVDAWLQTDAFLDAVSRITGIPGLLYDPDYVDGGTHENVDGAGLNMHVDFNYHPRDQSHRRINLIVYLNPEWEEAWGGALELAGDPWDPADRERISILPAFNRAVVFETNEHSWHGFPSINLPADRRQLTRKSFAIYLYSRERPGEEVAPAHATVYVPEPPARHLVPGYTLRDSDATELERRYHRVRNYLRNQYQREQDFSRQIGDLERALREARDAVRIDLLGYARQVAVPRGFWPDGWVAREAAVEFELVEACTSALAQVWVPDALAEELEVAVSCNGRTERFPLGAGIAELSIPIEAVAGERLTLSFESNCEWRPSDDGASRDSRPLVFRLLQLRLEH